MRLLKITCASLLYVTLRWYLLWTDARACMNSLVMLLMAYANEIFVLCFLMMISKSVLSTVEGNWNRKNSLVIVLSAIFSIGNFLKMCGKYFSGYKKSCTISLDGVAFISS